MSQPRPETSPSFPHPAAGEIPEVSGSLLRRLLFGSILLALESFAVASFLHPWLPLSQATATPIVFCTALLWFGRDALRRAQPERPIQTHFLLLHGVAILFLAAIEIYLLHHTSGESAYAFAVILWFLLIAAAGISLLAALVSPRRIARLLGSAWGYAIACATLAMVSRTLVRMAWDAPDSAFGQAMVRLTFASTRAVLQLFYNDVVANPATADLGTPRFLVQVAGTCSGIEGLALMLTLTTGWLWYARRELRLERALWLIPIALGIMWALNILRLAALIALGDAGHPEVAMSGFHSQAGWIAFTLASVGFLSVVNNMPFFRSVATSEPVATSAVSTPAESTAAIVYLLPFLAIVATSMFTRAASSGFEWLYPLRLVVCTAVLWHFRKHYRLLDWKLTWLGPATGFAIGLVWIAFAHHAGPTRDALPGRLATLAPWQRLSWLLCRVTAAVVTVPLAEELAFRGYLARRILSPDIESIPLRTLTLPAVLVSALAFGALHGSLWWLGTLAGIAFALVAKARNRLSEAIYAHAAANLTLAAAALVFGFYELW